MIGKIFKQKIFFAFFVGFIFLIAELMTMGDYNMMWDARNHFFRGQAFANYFLSGRKDYKDLPITKEYARYYRDYTGTATPYIDIEKRLSKDPNYRRSIYQDDVHTFDWLMKQQVTGHPTISDTISAFFNITFYEKLGWLRDDHAYAFYGIVLASILVSIFFYWIYTAYGFFSAIVATLVLATTPLFWAESHYNIKDIPLLVFFSLAIWAFWQGVRKYSLKWIIFSSVIGGFALGTKFNALFLPVIIFSWAILYLIFKDRKTRKKYFLWWWILPAYPLIMFLILTLGWPQMWKDPIGGFLNVLAYYREVGLNIDYTPAFRTIFNFSTYPSIWIFYTTYPMVIILAVLGIVGWLVNIRKTRDLLPILFLFWLVIPIARASLPNTSIFGGVRHIIEYIPALSFFAGYGVYAILKTISLPWKKVAILIILVSFIPFFITLIKLHPAENVYFNSFIKGLPGAKNAKLTGWGNTDGGIYREAVIWLNKNAEKNAHIATAFSELADFYIPEFRKDLLADNLFSGYLQKGEYIVALTHDTGLEHTYRMRYPENSLEPVYLYAVDGVPLIKIWKNDKEHLKKEVKLLKEKTINPEVKAKDNELIWDLGNVYKINHIDLELENKAECTMTMGNFQISEDNNNWNILPETYPGGSIEVLGNQPKNNKLIAPIADLEARYISFFSIDNKLCLPIVKKSIVWVLVN